MAPAKDLVDVAKHLVGSEKWLGEVSKDPVEPAKYLGEVSNDPVATDKLVTNKDLQHFGYFNPIFNESFQPPAFGFCDLAGAGQTPRPK